MFSDIVTYKSYCKWVAEEICKSSVDIPGYGGVGKPLGCDSSGGSDAKAYATMCKKGYLTTSSQEGYCDDRETQYSFVDFLIPATKVSYFISKLVHLVRDGTIDMYHLNNFTRLNVDETLLWEPHTKRVTLTIVDGKDTTGYWPEPYDESDSHIYWVSQFGFPEKLCENLAKCNLQSFSCVMRCPGIPIMQYILPLF